MYNVPENLKKTNLKDVGYTVYLDWDSLEDEVKSNLVAEGYDSESPVCKSIVDQYGLWDVAGDCCYDEEAILWELEGSVIKNAPHYLVMAHNCTWSGASGYRFANDIKDAFRREHDATIYPVCVSRGGKCLVCIESSHDVPMGARTSVIALTDSEYERLNSADWDTVASFAKECERRAV